MVRVLELFAGIGACSKALTRLGIEHEIADAVEIDKYAIQSFNAIHGTSFDRKILRSGTKTLKSTLSCMAHLVRTSRSLVSTKVEIRGAGLDLVLCMRPCVSSKS